MFAFWCLNILVFLIAIGGVNGYRVNVRKAAPTGAGTHTSLQRGDDGDQTVEELLNNLDANCKDTIDENPLHLAKEILVEEKQKYEKTAIPPDVKKQVAKIFEDYEQELESRRKEYTEMIKSAIKQMATTEKLMQEGRVERAKNIAKEVIYWIESYRKQINDYSVYAKDFKEAEDFLEKNKENRKGKYESESDAEMLAKTVKASLDQALPHMPKFADFAAYMAKKKAEYMSLNKDPTAQLTIQQVFQEYEDNLKKIEQWTQNMEREKHLDAKKQLGQAHRQFQEENYEEAKKLAHSALTEFLALSSSGPEGLTTIEEDKQEAKDLWKQADRELAQKHV